MLLQSPVTYKVEYFLLSPHCTPSRRWCAQSSPYEWSPSELCSIASSGVRMTLLLKMKDAAYLKQQQQQQNETLIYATESISGRIRIQSVFFNYLFIFGFAGSLLLHMDFSSCGEQGRILLWSTDSYTWASVVAACRFSSCGARTLATLQYFESSLTGDQTCVPCIGGQILIHCATREVLVTIFKCL